MNVFQAHPSYVPKYHQRIWPVKSGKELHLMEVLWASKDTSTLQNVCGNPRKFWYKPNEINANKINANASRWFY